MIGLQAEKAMGGVCGDRDIFLKGNQERCPEEVTAELRPNAESSTENLSKGVQARCVAAAKAPRQT